jgi:thioredoxin reductase
MTDDYDVVIVGAGPYGLSAAAHLKQRRNVVVFGVPMQSWEHHMPVGMMLKSEGHATNLSDPDETYPLGKFCRDNDHAYSDIGLPVRLDTFVAYGKSFQSRFVPNLRQEQVVAIDRTQTGFALALDGERTVFARRVVVAAGIRDYAYIPPPLASLPKQFVTHSSEHCHLSRFADRRVAVVGAGASAVDTAVLLKRAGAEAHLISRRIRINFNSPVRLPRPMLETLRAPMSGIGAGWLSRFCTDAPLAFRRMPESFRLRVVNRHLGPAPGWFVREEAEQNVAFHLGRAVEQAESAGERLLLTLNSQDDRRETLVVDHLIAATGYSVDLARVPFLKALRSDIELTGRAPALSGNFESSVPGLYFIGMSAANSFGPMLRFVYGARFTASRVAHHIARR